MPEIMKINHQTYIPFNMKDYVLNSMPGDMQQFALSGRVKSGYANLDAITNLYPGLYILGALPSLGKTTFALQMADQLAMAGEHVIYFSLEQNVFEMATKSLSRIMAQEDETNALTSLQIRRSNMDSRIQSAIDRYNKFSDCIEIVECSFDTKIGEIEGYVESYISNWKIRPIVFVDYLQVLDSSERRLSARDQVEMSISRLKQLQKNNGIVIIALSSLNRANYMTEIDFESFKETGCIEAGADVVWGMQMGIIHDDEFREAGSKISEKRELFRKAKAETPRSIELCCLKNRFGVSSYRCCFDYYPQYDLFIPNMNNIDLDAIDNNVDIEGFASIPAGYDLPF